MRYFTNFLLLFSIGLILSCKKEEEPAKVYRLTPEDLTWNIYQEGDTLHFLSNLNHSLCYRIGSINHYIEFPADDDNWASYEGIAIKFYNLDSLITDKHFTMDFVRGNPGDLAKGFLIIIYWPWPDVFGLPNIFNLPRNPNVDTLTVNNVLYHDVYKVVNCLNYDVVSAVRNLFYEKQKGWLRFELNSGETYDRIN